MLHISEGAEDIAEQLHSEIVKRIVNRIMLRIGRGEDYILTATDKWQIENLQSAGYLLEDIQKEIEKCVVLCSNCHRESHYLENKEHITIEEYLSL